VDAEDGEEALIESTGSMLGRGEGCARVV
jgi:hypothetical protein